MTAVADGLPHAWPADNLDELLAEAGEWGFPLYARDGGVQLEYPAAPLSAREIADIGGIDPAQIHLPLCCASTNAEILQDAVVPLQWNAPAPGFLFPAEALWFCYGNAAIGLFQNPEEIRRW